MSQTQTESKPSDAEMQLAVFVRMAAVMHDRTRPVDDLPADGRGQVPVASATGQARRGVAPHQPRAVERLPAHGVALTPSPRENPSQAFRPMPTSTASSRRRSEASRRTPCPSARS